MYCVVEISGHQYKVQKGDVLDVDHLKADEGQTLEFPQVLLVSGSTPKVGTPYVDGAKVKAEVLRHGKDRKFLVLKRRPRGWTKKNGHRTHYTCIKITDIK